jgi:hypothetical protein
MDEYKIGVFKAAYSYSAEVNKKLRQLCINNNAPF